MKGAKPKANAVRRQKDKAQLTKATGVSAVVLDQPAPTGISKPAEVARNPNLSATWDMVAGSNLAYQPEDQPLITHLVFELETARQCRERCMDLEGNVLPVIGKGEPDEVTGQYLDWQPNPWYKAMGDAMNRALKIADQLGCTPLARARLGLAQAAGTAINVSIAEQVMAAVNRARSK